MAEPMGNAKGAIKDAADLVADKAHKKLYACRRSLIGCASDSRESAPLRKEVRNGDFQ